jgi:bacterial/archaeal transporter family protein
MNYLWLIFALFSAFFASLIAIFGKIGLQNIDANTATAIRAIIMAIFLFIVIAVQGKLSQISIILSDHKAILFIVFSGVAGGLSWLFYFLALKMSSVDKVVPIDRLSIVFAVLLAAIFLSEKLTWKIIIGVVLMTIGAIFVAI